MTSNVSRRNFLAGSLATAVGLPLLSACGAAGPSASPAGTAGAQGAAKTLLPTYIPVQNGPKPDYHDDNPLFSDAFDNFPKNPQKVNDSAPGSGSQRWPASGMRLGVNRGCQTTSSELVWPP